MLLDVQSYGMLYVVATACSWTVAGHQTTGHLSVNYLAHM